MSLKDHRDVTTARPPPIPALAPSRNPLLGSWAPSQTNAVVDRSVICTGGDLRDVGQPPEGGPTRDGHILRATSPEGVSPIIGRGTLAPLVSWLPPRFTSRVPHKGQGHDWLLSPRAHDKRDSHRGRVVVVVLTCDLAKVSLHARQ